MEKYKIKNYLNKAYRLTKIKEMLEREYFQKQKEIDSITVSDSEIRSNNIISKVENKVLDLVSLKKDIDLHSLKINEVKKEIENVIDKLEDETLKKLLKLRYLEFRKWRYIGEVLNYSEQHIHRLHNQALKEITKALKDVS